jgi:hypothetical protein
MLDSLREKMRRSEHKTEEEAPAAAAASASEAARVLGHYELLHTLGKGGSGKVSSNCNKRFKSALVCQLCSALRFFSVV